MRLSTSLRQKLPVLFYSLRGRLLLLSAGLLAGRRFLDGLKMCDIVANLGDARTTVTHPASTTHSALTDGERRMVGITPGLIRVSVGLEHIDDIVADIDQALGN